MAMSQTPDTSALPPHESKPTIGLLLLTALWAWLVLVDGPLLVRLAFVGEQTSAQVVDCKDENGALCRVRTTAGGEGLLRNSLVASYKPGTTIAVRQLAGRPDTLRSEGQIVRSTALRLFAAFVLAVLWLRQWAKSKAVGKTPAAR
jgi:hypothetical protein